MRHQKFGLTLSRTTEHRKALFSNLVAALFTHGKIRTTHAKAQATRRLAERTITWARRVGDVVAKNPEKRSNEESARLVHAVRMARRVVRDRDAVSRLFAEIGPLFASRPGGYTRIVRLGQRPGDAAEMSLLELIGGEALAAAAADDKAEAKPAAKAPKAEAKEAAEKPAKKTAAKSAAKAEAATEAAPKKKAAKAK